MEIQQFLVDFAAEFDSLKPTDISANTELESIEEWSSLQALSIIAMIDAKYDRKVSGTEVNKAHTVGEIFQLVNQ